MFNFHIGNKFIWILILENLHKHFELRKYKTCRTFNVTKIMSPRSIFDHLTYYLCRFNELQYFHESTVQNQPNQNWNNENKSKLITKLYESKFKPTNEMEFWNMLKESINQNPNGENDCNFGMWADWTLKTDNSIKHQNQWL